MVGLAYVGLFSLVFEQCLEEFFQLGEPWKGRAFRFSNEYICCWLHASWLLSTLPFILPLTTSMALFSSISFNLLAYIDKEKDFVQSKKTLTRLDVAWYNVEKLIMQIV